MKYLVSYSCLSSVAVGGQGAAYSYGNDLCDDPAEWLMRVQRKPFHFYVLLCAIPITSEQSDKLEDIIVSEL